MRSCCDGMLHEKVQSKVEVDAGRSITQRTDASKLMQIMNGVDP